MGSNKLPELGTMSSTPSFFLFLGFVISRADSSLFVYSHNIVLLYFLVYVGDLIITGSGPSLVDNTIQQLDSKFSTKDLRVLSHFCGVEVLPTSMGLLLSQQKHVIYFLSTHNMLDSKPTSTLPVMGTSLTTTDSAAPVNATMYSQMVGGLQHL